MLIMRINGINIHVSDTLLST